MTPIEKLFSSIPNLPSIPRVVQELITSLGDEDADIGSLVKQVKQDQSLSARVLRLANSSYYGASHKVGAIDDAVTLIGLNSLRTLVIASGVSGAFAKIDGVDLKAFWRHSMLTAGIARMLGKHAGVNGEFSYTAGLMHRLGQLLIDVAFPDAGRQITQQCKNHSIGELAAIERSHVATDHSEVGAELAKRWNFPAVIHNALHWYVDPLSEAASPHAGVVHLAARIAFGIEAGQDTASIVAGLDSNLMERLVLDADSITPYVDEARELLQSAEQML